MSGELRLIIVSGLSGSGKSVALHVLEDLGYYCIDNLPASSGQRSSSTRGRGDEPTRSRCRCAQSYKDRLAVGVDARSHTKNLDALPDLLQKLREQGVTTDIIFLHASDEILVNPVDAIRLQKRESN
jgi:UPF0042 nucleotide-binding protein